MATLKELREQIDQTDAELVSLLNHRAELVLEVKKAKEKEKADIYSPERERLILERVRKLSADGPFPPSALERIFTNIISATRSLIGEITVCYLGADPSLARDAAVHQFGETVRFCSELRIDALLEMLVCGEVHYGVLPERALGAGLLPAGFTKLMRSSLVIIAEVEVNPGVDAEERFLVLGHKMPAQTGRDKTSLVCAASERAGALRDLLQPFASRGINLLRIESKLLQTSSWDYLFFIDLEGYCDDPEVKAAIEELHALSVELKVLGSYPIYAVKL